MYHKCNIQQFYVLPTQCIYVFCVDLRTSSDYFPMQHLPTGFYYRDLNLYSPLVTICTTIISFNNSTFYPHSVFVCFVLISEKFPHTTLTNWFYNRELNLYSPVVTICTISLTFNNPTFCPHSVFFNFVWISKHTAIISLYRDGVCLLRAKS